MSGRAGTSRLLVAALLAAWPLDGCSSSTPPATPVTLIAENTLGYDIFVPNTQGEGGMAVESLGALGASPTPLAESAPCPCEMCSVACAQANTCDCSLAPSIHRIRAGASFTRTFGGTTLRTTRADCGAGDFGPICYQPAAAIASGTYEVQLCYATDAAMAAMGADDIAESLTAGTIVCVTKSFTYPATTQVIISPAQPTACSSTNTCPNGEICQRGVCSANCLSSGVPTLGASWDTSIEVVSNEALFVEVDGGNGVLRASATATVGAASYVGEDLNLSLYTQVGVGRAIGEVRVSLAPSTPVVPLIPGEVVSVLVLSDVAADSSAGTVTSGAGTIRDSNGNLLLAVDEGRGGLLLQPSDLLPFTVDAGGDIFGCDATDFCGKKIYRYMTFSTGSASATVSPGQTGTFAGVGGLFAATVVANYQDQSGSVEECGPEPVNAFDLVLSNRPL